ncbi:hypothetical protein MBAV_005997 [Candidatus Magnetobacterium bavaricum]|uniref:Uncharacterized protein n=1 Tax=Candidatus Magnetobacterium bavaricum TaxID=29290 RepID=A0A0F3GMB6_9BACT|nr:hypothetical protein MBAV_005997 [Candidatus Magnetobacterium bavaricum]
MHCEHDFGGEKSLRRKSCGRFSEMPQIALCICGSPRQELKMASDSEGLRQVNSLSCDFRDKTLKMASDSEGLRL